MFKLVLIVVLVYLLIRAGRNLLRAAVRDGLVARDGWEDRQSAAADDRRVRRSKDGREIEDAVWEDLP